MKSHNLQYETQGLYFCHSAISQLNHSLREVQNCANTYAKQIDSIDNGFFGFALTGKRITSLDDIYPLLVVEHERNHYTQLMTTPCGLLLWRTLNSITTGIAYLTRTLTNSSSKNSLSLPLNEWYFSQGQSEISKFPPTPPDSIKLKFGIDEANYKKFIPSYIANVFAELDVLSQFLQALQGHSLLSMKEFVSLANQSFQYLSLRSDLKIDIEWTAHDILAPSYLPNNGFSMTEIIEAGARFREREILEGLNAGDNILKKWTELAIFNVYRPAYEWLISEVADSRLARIAIDISMMTPIDICCGGAVSGRIYVEDVLPNWRLLKVVQSIQNMFWSNDYGEQEYEVGEGIAIQSNIPSPRATAKACLTNPLSGPLAWGGDAQLYDVPDDLTTTQYYNYVESQVKRAFEIRAMNSLAFTTPNKLHNFQPAIEFFDDTAFFYSNPGSENNLLFYIKAYKIIILNLALLSLLSNGDVSELPHLQQSFSNRMAREGDTRPYEELWDVKKLLESAFDPELFRLLGW